MESWEKKISYDFLFSLNVSSDTLSCLGFQISQVGVSLVKLLDGFATKLRHCLTEFNNDVIMDDESEAELNAMLNKCYYLRRLGDFMGFLIF